MSFSMQIQKGMSIHYRIHDTLRYDNIHVPVRIWSIYFLFAEVGS